jgi:rubrerythrin
MTVRQPPAGLSVSEKRLFEHIADHIESEAGMLELYQTLAESEHPFVRYMAELIAEDEARHHRLFEQWLEAMESGADWAEIASGLPTIDVGPTSAKTLALLDSLIDFEKDDLRETKKLRKAISTIPDTNLWDIIVRLVMADTKKHLAMLKFIRDRVMVSDHRR